MNIFLKVRLYLQFRIWKLRHYLFGHWGSFNYVLRTERNEYDIISYLLANIGTDTLERLVEENKKLDATHRYRNLASLYLSIVKERIRK